MKKKIAIVTGATGNLGQAIIKKFISEGCFVVGTVIPDDATKLNLDPSQFEKQVVDLSDAESSQQFVDSVLSKYGRIDVAVLTVGGFAAGKIADTKTDDISRQYKLNFETTYNIARPAFVEMLKQNSGRIFIIGSRPGLSAKDGKGMTAYALAKSLVFRLADLLNEEAKGSNVVTTVVVPSTIDTAANRNSMPTANYDDWVKADQIAEIISFYATDAASTVREPIVKVYNNA